MSIAGYVLYDETAVYRAVQNTQGVWVVETRDRQNSEKFVEQGKYRTLEDAKYHINEISKDE